MRSLGLLWYWAAEKGVIPGAKEILVARSAGDQAQ
jgi:hypothetical protein